MDAMRMAQDGARALREWADCITPEEAAGIPRGIGDVLAVADGLERFARERSARGLAAMDDCDDAQAALAGIRAGACALSMQCQLEGGGREGEAELSSILAFRLYASADWLEARISGGAGDARR